MTVVSHIERGDQMPTETFFNLNPKKQNNITQAAIDLFSENQYEQVNIAMIIKKSHIPRGSFYAYFNDKEDLYLHLIDIVRQEKMKYLQDTLANTQEIPFLILVRKLYEDGVKFALEHPKYVRIMDFLLKNHNEIYDKIIADNLKIAEDIYGQLIDKDKERGLIRKEIDTKTFAKIIVEFTTNIAVEELNTDNHEESYKKMLIRNNQILEIIEKGVKQG